MGGRILKRFQSMVRRGPPRVAPVLSRWTEPSSASLPLSPVANLTRSKPQLIADNPLLASLRSSSGAPSALGFRMAMPPCLYRGSCHPRGVCARTRCSPPAMPSAC